MHSAHLCRDWLGVETDSGAETPKSNTSAACGGRQTWPSPWCPQMKPEAPTVPPCSGSRPENKQAVREDQPCQAPCRYQEVSPYPLVLCPGCQALLWVLGTCGCQGGRSPGPRGYTPGVGGSVRRSSSPQKPVLSNIPRGGMGVQMLFQGPYYLEEGLGRSWRAGLEGRLAGFGLRLWVSLEALLRFGARSHHVSVTLETHVLRVWCLA